MDKTRNILLLAFGILSEELRTLSLAEKLRERGHDVTFCGGSSYEQVCRLLGIGFVERVYPELCQSALVGNFTVKHLMEGIIWPQKDAMVNFVDNHLEENAYDVVGFDWPLSQAVHAIGAAGAKPVQMVNSPWVFSEPLSGADEEVAFHAYPSILHEAGHGFPFSTPTLLHDNVRAFLSEHRRPICFTAGSSVSSNPRSVSAFFRAAVIASERLKRPAIFVNAENYVQPSRQRLVLGIQSDCRSIFTECAVVVHHGGIVTTSNALWAGRPQVIVPYGFDQPDNGRRVAEAMAGVLLHARDFNVENLMTAIEQAGGLHVGASIAGASVQDSDRQNTLADDFVSVADNFYSKFSQASADDDDSGEEWKQQNP
jgi:UDP:flavonoid glycosyltransferase YjiC (YdhE family)